ncbi:hypothetical protein, partial [Streptomyces sp. NPDC050564]|uniref:hypothetical protein n=1 Tax=Streptomyces sp. NPDC050564 TaxID=3365631 RepID=UPI0037B40CF9
MAHRELLGFGGFVDRAGRAHFAGPYDLVHVEKALAVLPCEVGDAAGGWLAFQRGVSAVVIVGVQPL